MITEHKPHSDQVAERVRTAIPGLTNLETGYSLQFAVDYYKREEGFHVLAALSQLLAERDRLFEQHEALTEQRSLQDVRICDLQDANAGLQEQYENLRERLNEAEVLREEADQRFAESVEQLESSEAEVKRLRMALHQAIFEAHRDGREPVYKLLDVVEVCHAALDEDGSNPADIPLTLEQEEKASREIQMRAEIYGSSPASEPEKVQPWNRSDWPERSGL